MEAVNGRVPVTVGCLRGGQTEVIEMARHARSAGAQRLMVVPPYFYGARFHDIRKTSSTSSMARRCGIGDRRSIAEWTAEGGRTSGHRSRHRPGGPAPRTERIRPTERAAESLIKSPSRSFYQTKSPVSLMASRSPVHRLSRVPR